MKKIREKEIEKMIECSDLKVMIVLMENVHIFIIKDIWITETQQNSSGVHYDFKWGNTK